MLEAFRHLVHAAGYAIAGLVFMMRREVAARLEGLAVALALLWLIVLGRPFSDFVVLMMLGCILLAVEALNTAIELVVDRISPEQSVFAKNAKDLGSTAVFFTLVAGGLYLAAVTADAFGFVDL